MIRENVVAPASSLKFKPCSGTIIDINYSKRTAMVTIKDQHRHGELAIKAKLLTSGNSIKLSSFYKGDIVNISFEGESIVGATITGMYSSRKSNRDSHVLSNLCTDSLDNLGEEVGIRDITNGEAFELEVLYNIDYSSFVLKQEFLLQSYQNDDIGLSSTNSDSVIKIDSKGNIVLGAGLLASLVIKQDGVIEINSKDIIYKR